MSGSQGSSTQPSVALARGGLRAAAAVGWARGLGRFTRRRPLGAAGGLILVLMVVVAIGAPFVATHDPIAQDAWVRLQSPSITHLMGTDQFGRDLFSRIVYSARISLYVGLAAVAFGGVVGTITGVASAYLGGKVDMVIQRVVDTMLGFPGLILAITLMATLGQSINNVVIAISVGFTPRVARLARSTALVVRAEDYVLAAISIGARDLRVMFRHVLPNSLTSVIVLCTAYLGTAIITEASLSFLGLGVPPPDPTWGGMLRSGAATYMEVAPWMVIFPGAALSLAVFSFNLFGDALRDTLDPRLRGG